METSQPRTVFTVPVMLALSFTVAFLVHLLLFGTAPMVTMIMQELDLSHTEFGFFFSAAMISLILFRIPWGLISDRIGYLQAFKIALPLSVVSAATRALWTNQATFLVSQFFLGLGLAAVLPCLSLLVKEWSPKRLGLSTGVYVSGFAAGNATALGLTPYLLETMNWRHILLTYAGFAGVVCILWWCLARSNVKATSEFQFRNFGRILKDRYVWVLLFFIIASMGGYDTLATWMPKVLEMKALNTALASLLPLGFFVAGPTVGFVSDKFHDRRLITGLLGVIAAASIAGINYAPFPLLLLCLFFIGFTTTGVLTISLSIPAQHKRLSGSVGSVVGLISSLSNVGPLAVPVLFGFLIDITHTYYASILSVAILVGVIYVVCSMVKE